MKKIAITVVLLSIYAIAHHSKSWAWDDGITHRTLSDFAVQKTVLDPLLGNFPKSIGFNSGFNEILIWAGKTCDSKSLKEKCTISEWIKYGAEKEDAGNPLSARYRNHFHDPTKGTGLDDYVGPFPISGESALQWAQNSAWQIDKAEGDQSWETARKLFREALTAEDHTERQAKFAQMFKGLGHQMHLVQDMAVPAHVRNDAHAEETIQGNENGAVNMWVRKSPLYFETWAKKNTAAINAMAAGTAIFPDLRFNEAYASDHGGAATCPVSQLWDSDVYIDQTPYPSADTAQGLAEYTNSNFFSEDTIFAAERHGTGDRHYFPYPKESSLGFDDFFNDIILPEEVWAEDGLRDFRLHIPKHSGEGEAVNHFVAVGYFSALVAQIDYDPTLYRTFYLDELCHQDYAEKLVPRAVGYSAALLDYFFRGQLDIHHPFVKLTTDGTDIFIGGFDANGIFSIPSMNRLFYNVISQFNFVAYKVGYEKVQFWTEDWATRCIWFRTWPYPPMCAMMLIPNINGVEIRISGRIRPSFLYPLSLGQRINQIKPRLALWPPMQGDGRSTAANGKPNASDRFDQHK